MIDEFSADLTSNLYGNPHSASSPAALSGHRIDTIREKALRFFNADPDEWDLVFTANASAAIKLVVECIRDHAASTNTPVWYGYHRDAHTSLVGVRELVQAHRCFTSDEEVDLWIRSGGFGGARPRQLGLFAYPGQSNMTGRRLPWSWCGRVRKHIYKAPTYTLLDAAALASTAQLDLSDIDTAPDFISLSFYKIFGFPNIGALLVRKASSHILRRRKFFGGGTVDMVIAVGDTWHAKKDTALHDSLEDGTLPFHSIFALDHAIDVHERLYGPQPMKFISHHTAQLARRLFEGLVHIRHANGLPLVVIYADSGTVWGDPTTQGATIVFNVRRATGELVGYEEVEQAADQQSIYLRSGSLCNPGGVATYLGWTPSDMRRAYEAGHRCSNPQQVVMGRPTGVVRVSLGAMNVAADVEVFLSFIERTYVNNDATIPVPKITPNSLLGSPDVGSSGSSTPTVTALASPRPVDTTGLAATSSQPTVDADGRPIKVLPTKDSKISLINRRATQRGVRNLEIRTSNNPLVTESAPSSSRDLGTPGEDHSNSRGKRRFGRGVAALLRKPQSEMSQMSPRIGTVR